MGEQIAFNKEVQHRMFIHEENEVYSIVSQPVDSEGSLGLIRGEYHPIGNKLVYPKKWGRKKAAKMLLQHRIDEQERIVASAQRDLEKLTACMNGVGDWSDTD